MMMQRPSLVAVVVAGLLTLASAVAQPTLGLTVHPVSPNGSAFGVQFTLPLTTFDLTERRPVELALRADATMPFTLDLYPSADLAISFRFVDPTPDDDERALVPYLGTGIGLWHTRIFDIPCSDLTWTVHAGVDVPVAERLALRADVQAAPLIGDWTLGIGIAYSFGR